MPTQSKQFASTRGTLHGGNIHISEHTTFCLHNTCIYNNPFCLEVGSTQKHLPTFHMQLMTASTLAKTCADSMLGNVRTVYMLHVYLYLRGNPVYTIAIILYISFKEEVLREIWGGGSLAHAQNHMGVKTRTLEGGVGTIAQSCPPNLYFGGQLPLAPLLRRP